MPYAIVWTNDLSGLSVVADRPGVEVELVAECPDVGALVHDSMVIQERLATSNAGQGTGGAAQGGGSEQVTTAGGRVLNFTEKSIGNLKRAEQRRGADALARKYGYANAAEMDAALGGGKPTPKQGASKPVAETPSADSASGGLTAAERKELAELREKNKRLADERAKSDRIARESRRKQEAAEVEATLKVAAHRAGIDDVDYALTLYARHVQGKSEQELKRIDSKAFFTGLKTTHPHLFVGAAPAGAVEKKEPATTGTGGKTEDGAAAPQTPANAGAARPGNGAGGGGPAQGGGKTFDARSATREQLDTRLAELGLQNPAGASF
jgi:hypothetical protein